MTTRKLLLEVSESLFQQLKYLAEATDQPVESLAINCITRCLPKIDEEVYNLDEILAGVTPDNLHGEIGFGEPVGREFR